MTRADYRMKQGDRTICDICLGLHAVKTGLSDLTVDYTEKHVAEDLQLLQDVLKTWTPSPSLSVSFDESVRYMMICILLEYGVLEL
jgi:hypothetical protein